MKKIISILTCLALVFAMIPCATGVAFADDSTTAALTSLAKVAKEASKTLTTDLATVTTDLATVATDIATAATYIATATNPEAAEALKDAITMVGGWAKALDGTVSEEVKAAIKEQTQELLGAEYEPVKIIATQVVAGTNYMVLCKATLVTEETVTKYVYMTLYRDLEDNWSITNIEDILTTSVSLKAKSVIKTISGKKSVKITISEADDQELDFDKYIVYRATSKNGKYTKVGTTTKLSYVDSAVKAGKTYYYKIKGFKDIDGEKIYSKYSTVISKKVK